MFTILFGSQDTSSKRELGNVPKMAVNLSLYLKPHKLNEYGLVTVTDHHWSVSTAYRGVGAEGTAVVDERLTIFISNADESFSPAIVRLSRESATKLFDELKKQLDIAAARKELKDAMTVTFATQPYKLNDNQVVHLAEENLTCEVLQAAIAAIEAAFADVRLGSGVSIRQADAMDN